MTKMGDVAIGIIATFFVLSGCKQSPMTHTQTPKPSSGNGLLAHRRSFETGSGSTDVYTLGQNRERAYHVRWQKANLAGEGSKRLYATATMVSGTIYRLNKPQTTFSANQAVIDRTHGLLTLSGNVQFHSILQKASVKCNVATFIQSLHLIKAKGDVSVNAKNWNLGSFPEVWMSQDLEVIATPDMFSSILHNSSLAPHP